MTLSLGWLPQTAFFYMLIFARVGTMIMLAPAFGEASIPSRLRLSFALLLTLVFFPLVTPKLPALPLGLIGMGVLVLREIVVGLILGTIARLVVVATQTAGAIIAFQAGLSMAQANDPSQPGVQGAMVGNFLTVLGITLVFATNLHHLVLAAIHDSYSYFPVTGSLMLEDAAFGAVDAVAEAFIIGVQMAAPFILFGLVFYLGLGLLARLMPQLQVLFIAMPANVGLGLVLLMVLLVSMMGWYLSHFESHFSMLRF